MKSQKTIAAYRRGLPAQRGYGGWVQPRPSFSLAESTRMKRDEIACQRKFEAAVIAWMDANPGGDPMSLVLDPMEVLAPKGL